MGFVPPVLGAETQKHRTKVLLGNGLLLIWISIDVTAYLPRQSQKVRDESVELKADLRAAPKIGLIGEGTYPVAKGGVSTWYDQLITGLTDHEFVTVTLVGDQRRRVWDVPANVTSVQLVPVWDPPKRAPLRGRRAEAKRVSELMETLWRIALSARAPGNDIDAALRVEEASKVLQALSRTQGHCLLTTLSKVNTAAVILHSWNSISVQTSTTPKMTLSEAAQTASLANRVIAVLDTEWPQVDVTHASSSGPSSLIGLARKWNHGTPLILTEHGIYLRERYLALGDLALPWTVRAAFGLLMRLISEVTYAEANVLAPVSQFNAKWERKLGAPSEQVTLLYNGVHAATYREIETEPDVPTVSFVGRIDPLKDLHNLVAGFKLVRKVVPQAKLRIFGPVPKENHQYYADLLGFVNEQGLKESVSFEGAVPNAVAAIKAGHVVALSSISEGLPFTLIEAMMSGRATVSTNVGGVSEITGEDGSCGLVVPPRDPEALANALLELLLDDDRRQEMGVQARKRALKLFTLKRFRQEVRDLYARNASPREVTESVRPISRFESLSQPRLPSRRPRPKRRSRAQTLEPVAIGERE